MPWSIELALEGSHLTRNADWVCVNTRPTTRQEEHPPGCICEPLCQCSFTPLRKRWGFAVLPRTKWYLKHAQDLCLEFQRVALHQYCWTNSLLLPQKDRNEPAGIGIPHVKMLASPVREDCVVSPSYSDHIAGEKECPYFPFSSVFCSNVCRSCPRICWFLWSERTWLSALQIPLLSLPTPPPKSSYLTSHIADISSRFHALLLYTFFYHLLEYFFPLSASSN